jgi:RNA-directed DNA polymerase
MNSSQYKKSQLKYFCSIIGCKTEEIIFITTHLNEYYDEWPEQKKDKTTGELIRYKDGTIKQRIIRPSVKRLKIIQRAIKEKILAPIPLPESIYGGIKGKSNIYNAKAHQGHKYQFTTDLQNFFPSIKHNQVYKTFIALGFSTHFAYWITKLTTWKCELPQGTPTSTHIANLVFFDMDKKLIPYCQEHNLTYTRYVDDLTFSSQQDFHHLLNEILDIIKSGGFNISYRKTFYKGHQLITGINVFNNFIDAPLKIREKAKAEKLTNDKIKPYTNYQNGIRKTNRKHLKSKPVPRQSQRS